MSKETKISYEFQDDSSSDIDKSKHINVDTSSQHELYISSEDEGTEIHNIRSISYQSTACISDLIWTTEEDMFFWAKCKSYLCQIGRKKKFQSIKEMWAQISKELGSKSFQQCEQRYRSAFSHSNEDQNEYESKLEETTIPNNHAVWTEKESNLLIKRYTEYISQSGPLKKFRLRKDIWRAISAELGNKTLEQCSAHFYLAVRKRKKLPKILKMSVNNHLNKSKDKLEKPKKFKFQQAWTEEEIERLFEKYNEYLPQIGPCQKFRFIKDIWKPIASELKNKSSHDCQQQFYNTITRYRNKAKNDDLESIEQENALDRTEMPELGIGNHFLDPSNFDKTTINTDKRWMEVSKVEVEDYEMSDVFEESSSTKRVQIKTEEEPINNYSDFLNFGDYKRKLDTQFLELSKIKVEDNDISEDLNCLIKTKSIKIEREDDLLDIHYLNSSNCDDISIETECMQKTEIEAKIETNDDRVKLDLEEDLDKRKTEFNLCVNGWPSSLKQRKIWHTEETYLLFDRYKEYSLEIGPNLKFRTKKEMWKTISTELGIKTLKQCERHYHSEKGK